MTGEKSLEEKLCECLKNHELPDYLLYTGVGGAKNWLKLDGTETFPVARQLKGMLEKNLESIVRFIPTGMNLVSMGVGTGEKERIFLEALVRKNLAENQASGKVSIRYYPIDINSEFVDLALEKVKNLPIEKTGIVGFIEDMAILKKNWRLPVLFCILGNTFCNYEPEFILQLVRENLEQGDFFFFDANLLPAEDQEAQSARKSVMGTYASRENAIFNMYPLLQYGMAPDDFDFELLLAHVNSSIGEVCRTRKSVYILKDTEITIGAETIGFREGDVIRMGFTYKYTYDQITAFLEICGFELLKAFLSEDRANVIILAKKRI
ncbi:L-histidine N(alpha)-methyltransferase [Methanosarcina sp. UBA411]|uniref:L-histidine N(alpha)-methyltransferase n=1 Tax=Methanosarcina sp. UBA411 TaxID=1915589 RepID=UPI0025DA79D1|nr:L-histidine N(alpha)-methyltransferase [Methanosarcina sp. UBA411]